jgi:DNA-binding transcriptional ArsR family regulator
MSDLKTDFIKFLKVLADQTRLDILELLRYEKKTASEIQSALSKSQSTISQHLQTLSNKNLIILEKIDNVNTYTIKDPDIFKLFLEINYFVMKINQEKLKDLRDLDVIDTLL